MELRDRVAIVTGGSAGLGAIVAARLRAEGANVVVADLEGEGDTFVRADLRQHADVERTIAFAAERFGGLDLLINNAGGWGSANFPDPEWRATLELNLIAPMHATELAIEAMHGGGAVVNVASSAGLGLAPYDSPEYGAAKAGLIRFTATLGRLERVRVNCVVPGWVGLERAHAERAMMTPAQRQAAGPLIDPSEVAKAILWLALDDTLRGRVAIAYGGAPVQLLPAEEWKP